MLNKVQCKNALVAAIIVGSIGVVARGQVPGVEHFIIVGVDGLSPSWMAGAATPTFDRLKREGASTVHARAVMPTSSSPNWASMIMGAGPEQHGITSNDWERDRFEIAPVATGTEGIFPTIYGVIRQARPDAEIGVFHDWDGYGRLVERDSCDVVEDADGPVDATDRAVNYLRTKQPTFLFVHLDHVDHAGHAHGWGSPEYLEAVQQADRLIGQIVQTLEETGLRESTALLVTADHGGKDKGHGGATMIEIEIPWILTGPNVAPGAEITVPVNQYDTAATVAYAFGLTPPSCWIARPVREAFTTASAK